MHAFMCGKQRTMTMTGGNTDVLYQGEGRREMAESLQEQHPDVVKITRKWGRWQHQVDYSPFKRNRLKLKKGIYVPDGIDNCGMYLKHLDERERLLMIGQAPGRNGDPGDPLGGRLGKRLAKLAGVTFERYLDVTDRMNMFDEWPGKEGKGDKHGKDKG